MLKKSGSKTEYIANYTQRALLKRLPSMKDIADAAVLMVSDKASAITAAVMNVTCGEMVD